MDANTIWSRFLSELERSGVNFEAIKYADEASKTVVLEQFRFSPIERAIVSSQWSKVAQGVLPDVSVGVGLGGVGGGGGSMNMNMSGFSNTSSSSYQPQQHQPTYHHHQQQHQQQQLNLSSLNPPSAYLSQQPQQQYNANSSSHDQALDMLRVAFSRGDCTTAMALASDLLQKDGAKLIRVLHEYMPHVSEEQIGHILGVDVRSTGGGGGAPSSTSQQQPLQTHTPTTYQTQQHQFGSPGQHGGGGGGGVPRQTSMNGVPCSPGLVLTAANLAAQYGTGFSAICNGAAMAFPHTVRVGDTIVVRPSIDQSYHHI